MTPLKAVTDLPDYTVRKFSVKAVSLRFGGCVVLCCVVCARVHARARVCVCVCVCSRACVIWLL